MDNKAESMISNAAKELSRLGAAKGGKARANVLTPEERRDIARKAVMTRWQRAGKIKPKESEPESADSFNNSKGQSFNGFPYSMFRGELTLGPIKLNAHVLSDGSRVLTQGEVVRALTGGTETSNLGRYLSRIPIFNKDFSVGPIIEFKVPGNPTIAKGYPAELLIEICDRYLKARELGLLKGSQSRLAKQAEIIVRACAKVGIIALIDEVTGFQEVREKQALQLKIQAFIADEMQEWARMFPDGFWFELARLEGIHYSPRNRPLRWGRYIMCFVYDAIDKDIGKQLRLKNPNPHFLQNHHQWLKKFGRDKVHDQIQKVVTIMQLCDDMDDFRVKFARVFKKSPLQLKFDFLGIA